MALASRFIYLMRPWDPDAAIFIYMGRLVAQGGVFWRDLVDNKFPSVGFLTSIAWRGLGSYWPGYILVQVVMMLLACLALGRAVVRVAGHEAWWPTVLFGLVYLNLNTVVFGGFQLETIHLFFASLAAMAAVNLLSGCSLEKERRAHNFLDALTVGLCAGCAVLAKPTGLSVLAATFLAVVLYQPRLLRLIVISAGMIVGLALVVAALGIYLYQTDSVRYLPEIWQQLRLYATNSATDWRDLNKIVWAAGVLGYPLLARWWINRRSRESQPKSASRAAFVFAWLWLGIELLGVVMQKRMYGYHFLVLAPPAALIFGLLNRPVTLRAMALTLAPALGLSLAGIGQVIVYSIDYQRPLESGQWLTAHADPHDLVWRDMTSRLLIETDFAPGSRYLLTFLFANSDDAPQRYWREMKRDFERNQPRWMVLPNDPSAYLNDTTMMVAELERLPQRRQNYLAAWAELENYIHDHYQPVARLSRETIWQRQTDRAHGATDR